MSSLLADSWILISVYRFNLLGNNVSVSLWKTPLYTHERVRVKKTINVFSCKSFRFHVVSKRDLGIPKDHNLNLGTITMSSLPVRSL